MVMKRSLALDAMRGFTIAAMILVNTPGSWSHIYAPLRHAQWHGATPTDYIFPFFMFMVGAALFLSSRRATERPRSEQTVKILKRTALLFLIGLALNAYPFTSSPAEWRILGVLQRIALAYGAAAFICWLPGRWRAVIAAILMLGYWAVMVTVPEPWSLEGNLVRSVDLAVLGANHMWSGLGIAFDPEGLLSTLPSIVSIMAGFEVTRVLMGGGGNAAAKTKVAIAGIACVVIALAWHPVLPINKSLWTPPFVLVTTGAAIGVLLLLGVLERLSASKPLLNAFAIMGRNPLFIYVLSIVWVKTYGLIMIGGKSPTGWLYGGLSSVMSEVNASLAYALLHVALFWVIAWLLHRKGITISL